jgi:hypothetical protein
VKLRSWIEGKRVGLIANPRAGQGADRLDEALAALVGCLGGAEMAAVDGTREALAAKASGGPCALVRGGGHAGEAAERLLDAGAEVVVGVGGDGTLRDIAEAVVRRGSEARLIGIGVGSSNVGALVSAAAENAERLFDGDVGEVWVHALGVSAAGEAIGLAFHDVAFANTYFGTRAGRRMDLDAAAALRGEDRPAEPRSVCGRGAWVAKNGRRVLGAVEIEGGQVVASPLNDVDACRGRAVSGFLCWGPYLGCSGLLAAASTVMIRTRLEPEDLRAAEPLRLWHVGFSPRDVVEVGGLDGGAVVVDGTPKLELDPSVAVALTLREKAVAVLRTGSLSGCGGAVG